MILVVNPKASKEMCDTLKSCGHQIVFSMSYPNIKSAISTHPDIQIHSLDNNLAITPPDCYTYYRKQLPATVKLICGEKNLTDTYPGDSAYNVAKVGRYIFCNTQYTDKKLLDYYQGVNFSIIHINQGYSKCNIAVLDEHTIATEDIGIHNTIIANKIPIKSILVSKGEVSLEGFPYGFIGGACGGDTKQLFWYGNPEKCSYFASLKQETKGSGRKHIALSPEPLQDLGGIICVSP